MGGKYLKKSRRRPIGFLLALLGLVLLVNALGLVLAKKRQEVQAEKDARAVLAILETVSPTTHTVPETTVPETTVPETTAQETTVPETTIQTEFTGPTDPTDPITLSSEFVDGHEYVGYLEFPSLERKLPIMKIQYLEDLQIAPCLEKGSPHTDDAVICAHNYPSHFGPIRDWEGGEEVIFTDLEGHKIHYTVTLVEQISPNDVQKVMESEHDLVLYTCTTGGANRVMVACDRAE